MPMQRPALLIPGSFTDPCRTPAEPLIPGTITDIAWTDVKVGDALVVYDDELFPADLLCLYSALPDKARSRGCRVCSPCGTGRPPDSESAAAAGCCCRAQQAQWVLAAPAGRMALSTAPASPHKAGVLCPEHQPRWRDQP
jgi:hypothetical protein